MPNPITPYPIQIVGGANMVGDVIIEDMTQFVQANPLNNRLTVTLDSTQKAVTDAGNFPSGFANGDLLEVRINGKRSGKATATIDTTKAGITITVVQTGADYAGASIVL